MRDNQLIIGICSPSGPGSGKTHASLCLEDILEPGVRVSRNPLAGPLKQLYAEMMKTLSAGGRGVDANADKGTVVADIYSPGAYGGSFPATGRDFLVALGQGARHAFGSSFWLEICMERIFSTFDALQGDTVCVIDDVRYNNEARRILKASNSLLLCIVREGHEVEDSGDLDYKAIQEHPRVLTVVNTGNPLNFTLAIKAALKEGLTKHLPRVTIK